MTSENTYEPTPEQRAEAEAELQQMADEWNAAAAKFNAMQTGTPEEQALSAQWDKEADELKAGLEQQHREEGSPETSWVTKTLDLFFGRNR
ncbi:hypothetical protein [Streptomyces sp. CS014]|uniref:hypothetical protein n=1 Tax=Streptomyces sp. CS014 TaxID=2162707 RepID=UPI000D50B699|nr:hypothetical protein [Streptomyces sp. CS014]PVD04517.1 hypothetical protein DBP12_03585 [Streptomyces sp. CS014]